MTTNEQRWGSKSNQKGTGAEDDDSHIKVEPAVTRGLNRLSAQAC